MMLIIMARVKRFILDLGEDNTISTAKVIRRMYQKGDN